MSTGVHAPELDTGLGWLNTDRPLALSGELSGRIVVLDFWTYCCINCIHILPDLAELERKYAHEPVTFIGVHSAKFTNEASRETIRAAILRYEIQHPVLIDDRMKLWRAYAVRSWPTVVVVDGTGHIVGAIAGEGIHEPIDALIAESLAQGRAAGKLADGPLKLRREANVRAASGLAFPGKVLADEETNRLYIADSNHNRIIITELPNADGRTTVLKIVGTGEIGATDGPAENATFNHPQGLAVGHGNLYVADTENHLIRAIDLESHEVTTAVGTGEMCNDRAGGGMGVDQGLNSPWDIVCEGGTLYVAMAGTHQIWRIEMPVGFARALAGNGRENIVDGPAETSAFAQPSGICAMGGTLYIADSEVSAVRGINMVEERVFTVIGEGLFSFGDVDGVHPKAKLQHPMGVAAWGGSLVIADTYNHKIKLVDPGTRSVRTLHGDGTAGSETPDGKIRLFEPGGLSVLGDEAFVADTNNHRIVRINLKTDGWREIACDALTAPTGRDADSHDDRAITAEPVSIAPDQDLDILIHPTLPADAHLSPDAPWSVRVTASGTTLVQQTGKSDEFPLRVRIPKETPVATERIDVLAAFAYCTAGDNALCVPGELLWHVPIHQGGTDTTVTLSARVDA